MCSTLRASLHTSRVRSLHCFPRSTTCLWHRDHIRNLINSSSFSHSGQKGGENFKGELRKSLHNVRGSIGLGLETLVISSRAVYLCLVFSFYNGWFMFMLLLLLLETSVHFEFIQFSILFGIICDYLNACVAFSLYF